MFKEFISAQEFIPAGNKDYRILVLGEKTICIQRQGKEGDWRSNVSTGGSAKVVEVPESVNQMAKTIARLLGLDICSVDFIKNGEKFILIEVNYSPGVMAGVFKTKLASEMFSFLKQQGEKFLAEQKKARERGETKKGQY